MPWTDPDRAYERFGRCIAILNAWLQQPDGEPAGEYPLWAQMILSYIDEGVDESELVVGFLELSGQLLVRLEKYGEDPQAVLAEYAERLHPDGN